MAAADHCGTCTACLDICPTAAFPAPYRLDARRCISYLTIEHKGAIPRDLRPLIGNRIFGCDDCLAACPWNKFARRGREVKLAARADLRAPALAELAALDDAGFRKMFAGTAVKRTGRDRFLRNVLIAIGNSGDAALATDAERLLEDGAASYAGPPCGRWRGCFRARLVELAAKLRPGETDPGVRDEWAAARGGGGRETLVCLGFGYAAQHYVGLYGARFDRIIGTTRSAENAASLTAANVRRLAPSN